MIITDSSEKRQVSSNEYNERYSRKVPIQLGDLEQFVMALGVVDDYIEWMRFFKGVDIPGNGPAVVKQLKEARTLALALYNAPPPSETGEYCDRRRHNFVKLPGGIIATCTYCNRPEPPAQKASEPQNEGPLKGATGQ